MAYSSTITAFAQKVSLVIKNRYVEDIEDTDGQDFITRVLDWTNQFLDELEMATDPQGQPVFWEFLRAPDTEIGTAVVNTTTLAIPGTVRELIAEPERPLQILVGGAVKSYWTVVSPRQMKRGTTQLTVTKIGSTLYFSRPITAEEAGGLVVADTLGSIPRMTASEETALTLVKPAQLLVMGVAKNASLPDIVQGGLSPSFVQKYNDLLQAAIAYNALSADADKAFRDDWGFIGGIGF